LTDLRPFHFCPLCGTVLVPVEEDGHVRPTCPTGDFRQYGNPAAAANGIVMYDDRILLVQRGREPFAGLWALPGGFVEWDEEPAETATREVFEETGVRVRVTGRPILLLDTTDPRGNTVSANYPAEPLDPSDIDPLGGDDASAARWWPLEGIPVLAFENHTRAIESLGP
jgi:8-oxo-dGTP diphosphatase